MTTEVTATDYRGREDPREVAQELAEGTIDLDASGAGTVSVTLSGDLDANGVGLMAAAEAGDGTASVANLTASSLDVNVTGGTADQVDVGWHVVVSEDGHSERTDRTLSGGSAP